MSPAPPTTLENEFERFNNMQYIPIWVFYSIYYVECRYKIVTMYKYKVLWTYGI